MFVNTITIVLIVVEVQLNGCYHEAVIKGNTCLSFTDNWRNAAAVSWPLLYNSP